MRSDVIIIGAGPAGLSAAIYTSRAGLKTVVFGLPYRSNACRAHVIENYFGREKSVSGAELIAAGRRQAEKCGARLVEREAADIAQETDGSFTVTDGGGRYSAKAVIICAGFGFKPSGIKNENNYLGRGVSYCVNCDGPFFKNKKIAVIGNAGFAACEALNLTLYSGNIAILSHGQPFDLLARIKKNLRAKKIALWKTVKITEFNGKGRLEEIKFADGRKMSFDGVFMAVGIAGAADFANKLGLKRTGTNNAFISAQAGTGETNVKGIFAAGDCTGGNAQIAKSVGEGCNAAVAVIKFLKGIPSYVDYC